MTTGFAGGHLIGYPGLLARRRYSELQAIAGNGITGSLWLDALDEVVSESFDRGGWHPCWVVSLLKKIDGVASAALVDHLNCTFDFPAKAGLNDLFAELLPILWNAFAPAVDRKVGKYGYEHSLTMFFNVCTSTSITAKDRFSMTKAATISVVVCPDEFCLLGR